MMTLERTTKGTPFIRLDEKNLIVFSSSTANDIGYKRVVFSGVTTTDVSVSAGKGKSKVKSRKTVEERVSVSSDLTFTDLYKVAKGKGCILTKSSLDGLKRMLTPYLVSGNFPYNRIDELSNEINSLDKIADEDYLDEDPNGYLDEDDED
jgi:hypothetical protein